MIHTKHTLEEYAAMVQQAKTKQELADISYQAFLQDDDALAWKRSLSGDVNALCIQREVELGLL